MNRFIPVHEEIFLGSSVSDGSTAIVCQDERISFGQLDEFSSNLTWQLQGLGIGPGSMVGIYLHPSVNLAISIIAILKSGAAYIPLSHNFPSDRILYILQDANAALVIADDSLPGNPAAGQIQLLIPDWTGVKNPAEKKIPDTILIQDSDLAYIMYTSGSTGNPKGVMIEHRNLNYYIHWFCQSVMPETGVGLPLSSSFIFAAAVTQFFSTLLSGKTLHILDPLMVRQPGRLIEWFATHPQLGLYCVPTLWSEILNYLETTEGAGNKTYAPSCVYLSGEAVTDDLLRRSFIALPHLQLWNLYGPTEATANLTASRLYPGEPAHIGKPLQGTRIFIVGEDMSPVEAGITGELLASGEGIARGYLNLPELTRTTFFSFKLNDEDQLRVYRSGDLVKEDGSGRLIYIGRRDQQVKIRGFRIELLEIEHALLAIPEVKLAVVKVVEERPDAKRLIAYLVFKGENALPVNELRKILMRALPDFMVPEVFVRLERFPQLPNGKIDRKSLPMPGIQRPELGYQAVPPSTANEQKMVRIWEEVLGLEGIGMEDNFFDLGGNSLKAHAIVLELQAQTGVNIQIKNIFDLLTAGNLARHPAFELTSLNDQHVPSDESAILNPILPEIRLQDGDLSGILPSGLSENQKALWFLQQAEPDLAAYHIFYSITLTGKPDVKVLEDTIKTICDHHSTLKTTFPPKKIFTEANDPVLNNPVLEIFNPSGNHIPVPLREAISHARSIALQPLNLEQGPLCRFILYETDNHQYLLAFIVHHIVFDGFSFEVFLREFSTLYEQKVTTGKFGRIPLSASYAQFCQEEKLYLAGSEYLKDLQYWQNQLSAAPVFFEVPTDYTRPATPSREGGQVRRTISPMLKMKLKNLSDHQGASMYMTCLAAFSFLLYRHTGRTDFLIGTPVANRVKKSFNSLIGYFVNTMLFRAKIDKGGSFNDLLGQVRVQILENLSHSRFPFGRCGEILKTERIPGINPFFQVMFAYHEAAWEFSTSAGIGGVAGEEFFGCSKFDLFAEIFNRREDAEIVLTFSSRLYHQATIEILVDHFIQILEHICAAPQTSLNGINMLSPSEYDQTIHKWNQTAISHEITGNLVDLIELQIEKTPDLPALVSRQEVISYREMGRRAGIIAENLHRMGVTKGVPVGIHLENSPVMVLCIIAVFKAGGIYIPLDPYYPEARLRYVIEKTRIQFLVVDEGLEQGKQNFSDHIIPVGELLDEPVQPSQVQLSGPNDPGNLAYIMFTSGSTGNPKGVMIRHDSLVNFLVWTKLELNLSDRDTILSTTSINFDISFIELFAPLISGARLVLEKRSELQAPEKVEAILNEMKVNMVQFVPSGLKALSDAGVIRRARYLTCIISGGEKLSKTLQEQIFGEFEGSLINLYGPTEATVYMACWHCRRNSFLRMVPIGTPIFNAVIYILDENLKPVPVGVEGELYIGGQVLAEGYFEDPDQTAARFLPDPFIPGNGNRIYKTGDLARFLFDGSVEFLGRSDHQIKVRGFRVELGEIESNIMCFPGVRNAVVDARELREEDVRLTAYLVPEPSANIVEGELRDYLRLHLPAYMIPGHFIVAPAIPTLPNGKTDFKSLLNLRQMTPKIPEFIYRHMNETEMALIELWKEILEHGAFSPQDNFFEVGGHSLLLVKLKDLIAGRLKEEVSIVDLFHYPTISSLAAFLRKDKPDRQHFDIEKRVSMRKKNIRQQISKRNFPGKNQI